MCLAFIDEYSVPPRWECTDRVSSTNEGNYIRVSGRVTHFTNFGILLAGDTDVVSEGESVSSDSPTSKQWVIAVVVVVVVIVAVAVAVTMFYVKKTKKDKARKQMIQLIESNGQASRQSSEVTDGH